MILTKPFPCLPLPTSSDVETFLIYTNAFRILMKDSLLHQIYFFNLDKFTRRRASSDNLVLLHLSINLNSNFKFREKIYTKPKAFGKIKQPIKEATILPS